MAHDATPEDLQAERARGEQAAHKVAAAGPADPLLRVAWAFGFGQTDQLQAAVTAARAAGLTWKQIAAATGEHPATAATKYGGGRERQREYQRRRRTEG